MPNTRNTLEQEVVEALLETKAIDFEAAGAVLAKYGARAALAGTELSFVLGRKVIRDWCIPPFKFDPSQLGPIGKVQG